MVMGELMLPFTESNFKLHENIRDKIMSLKLSVCLAVFMQ